MAVLVKICGITNPTDALAAAEAGADAIGMVFHTASPRCVDAPQATAITQACPAGVRRVGLFVNATPAAVRTLVEAVGMDTLQFHGTEPPAYCREFAPIPYWKAFHMRDRSALAGLPAYEAAEAWLLDSHVPGQSGGTGTVFNWDWAVEAGRLGHRIILAGGLTPDNVAQAVRFVRPWMVDVSSGVESAPGRKDHGKLRAFVAAAKAAV